MLPTIVCRLFGIYIVIPPVVDPTSVFNYNTAAETATGGTRRHVSVLLLLLLLPGRRQWRSATEIRTCIFIKATLRSLCHSAAGHGRLTGLAPPPHSFVHRRTSLLTLPMDRRSFCNRAESVFYASSFSSLTRRRSPPPPHRKQSKDTARCCRRCRRAPPTPVTLRAVSAVATTSRSSLQWCRRDSRPSDLCGNRRTPNVPSEVCHPRARDMAPRGRRCNADRMHRSSSSRTNAF